MTDTAPAATRPQTIPLDTVKHLLGISLNEVRRAIAADTEDRLPDDIRRIPGGRRSGASYYVLRRQYERVAGPIAPVQEPTDFVKRRKQAG